MSMHARILVSPSLLLLVLQQEIRFFDSTSITWPPSSARPSGSGAGVDVRNSRAAGVDESSSSSSPAVATVPPVPALAASVRFGLLVCYDIEFLGTAADGAACIHMHAYACVLLAAYVSPFESSRFSICFFTLVSDIVPHVLPPACACVHTCAEPARSLRAAFGVRDFLYLSAWANTPPLSSALLVQQGAVPRRAACVHACMMRAYVRACAYVHVHSSSCKSVSILA
jgi:hypothetical protein